jgi:hypothetical protein
MMMSSTYEEPTALIAVSGVFLALGAVCALVVTGDILWRQGWKSMMLIMSVPLLASLEQKIDGTV